MSNTLSRPDSRDPGSAAIIGGGISGLTAAHRLASRGHVVTLFEASDRLGGLGGQFEHDGHLFDRFYHVILPGDDHLLSLAEELDLNEAIYWREASLGFAYRGRFYDLVGARDLLRFGPLPLHDRIRLGLTALWISHVAGPDGLDDLPLVDWLRRLSGKRAFERLWRPLLIAKFGDAYESIPALWYWSHFRREKGTGIEVKGYLRGGYDTLSGALAGSARDKGARLLLRSPVRSVSLPPAASGGVEIESTDGTHRFDSVVFCTPFALVPRLADETLAPYLTGLPLDLDHQGVVVVLLMLKRSVMPHYWMPVVDCGVSFRGIVETTRVIDAGDAADRHLVYLLNYVHRESDEYARSDEDLTRDYVDGLFRLFPDLTRDDLTSTHVFRTPYVEPIWTPGYGRRMPPDELVPGRVYLATTAQVYPHVTSWNQSIGLATRVADKILDS